MLLGAFACCCLAQARAPGPRPEPAALGVVCRWSNSQWEPLEWQRPSQESLEVMTPIRRQSLVFVGERSSVRLSETRPKLALRYRLGSPGVWVDNPQAGEFSLYLLRREAGRRTLVFHEQTPIRSVSLPGMPLLLSGLGSHSLELQPASELGPGEYSILQGCPPEFKEAFCFAIDSSP